MEVKDYTKKGTKINTSWLKEVVDNIHNPDFNGTVLPCKEENYEMAGIEKVLKD